jgi:hypothetical protein
MRRESKTALAWLSSLFRFRHSMRPLISSDLGMESFIPGGLEVYKEHKA